LGCLVMPILTPSNILPRAGVDGALLRHGDVVGGVRARQVHLQLVLAQCLAVWAGHAVDPDDGWTPGGALAARRAGVELASVDLGEALGAGVLLGGVRGEEHFPVGQWLAVEGDRPRNRVRRRPGIRTTRRRRKSCQKQRGPQWSDLVHGCSCWGSSPAT